jgi:hypothetical protein
MKLEDVYIVSRKRRTVTDEELSAMESSLKVQFPDDFHQFLKRFGSGEFCGCLYLFDPIAITGGQRMFKEMTSEGFYYDTAKSALTKSESLESVWVARTLDGDEIVYRSEDPAGFFVLPRHSETIQRLGLSFYEVLDWFASSGVMYVPTKFRWFCTCADRCRLHLVGTTEVCHSEASSWCADAFGIEHAEIDENEEFSILFSRRISGYIQVHSDSLDIHHDLDFDPEVSRIADLRFRPLGFRVVEHFSPKKGRE